MEEIEYTQLKAIEKELIEKASSTLKASYNPYSNFAVGAAITTKEGKIFTGTNVENASFGASICAEQVALTQAYKAGHRQITTLTIIGHGKNSNDNVVTPPCGICRQVYLENAQQYNRDIKVILVSYDHSKVLYTSIEELLPLGFGIKRL